MFCDGCGLRVTAGAAHTFVDGDKKPTARFCRACCVRCDSASKPDTVSVLR